MTNSTLRGCAVAATHGRAVLPVAGTCSRGEVRALLLQDGSGTSVAATGTTLPVQVVVARPRVQRQKYPFMTHGAAINGALSGPHRAWDPV